MTSEREQVYAEFGVEAEYNGVRELADEIVRLREALAAATRVRLLDEWRVVDKYGFSRRTAYDADQAENMREFLDRLESVVAPHRVVRVALVDTQEGTNDA